MAKPLSRPLPPDSMLARGHGNAGRAGEPIARAHTAAPPANVDNGAFAARPSHLTLAHGQSFHAYVSRGTVLHIERGDVVLCAAPRWLAASFWRNTVSLTAGQTHVAETSGWMTLSAGTGARIVLREDAGDTRGPAGPRSRAVRRAARLRQGFRERFGF
ncbi:hypothetical protein [Pandoraea bronchicola]|uniref:Uncharacterized protein n=1 Tax=Pandoraea bronchicola TaxID=2508287 RepID=A0A5E5BQN5_9BURK|nr:hypothetical protein [Pandoraea bronchicola]VVE88601.1 hypothetical protein PBR20603_02556 [Pandoraea bronchicola]